LISGQKVWTSLAHESDWCFVVARTEPGSVGHHGLSFLLVPMAQARVTVRPIEQLTGTSEFNEVFFDEAETDAGNIVGQPGEGWKIAMALLGFERGVSTLGQQMQFHNELNEIIGIARANGAARDPVLRQRIAEAWRQAHGIAHVAGADDSHGLLFCREGLDRRHDKAEGHKKDLERFHSIDPVRKPRK
jgi:alkylation response protein AidB-like acyl-CoA dehydrogenase